MSRARSAAAFPNTALSSNRDRASVRTETADDLENAVCRAHPTGFVPRTYAGVEDSGCDTDLLGFRGIATGGTSKDAAVLTADARFSSEVGAAPKRSPFRPCKRQTCHEGAGRNRRARRCEGLLKSRPREAETRYRAPQRRCPCTNKAAPLGLRRGRTRQRASSQAAGPVHRAALIMRGLAVAQARRRDRATVPGRRPGFTSTAGRFRARVQARRAAARHTTCRTRI